jgi:hypothetical protein
MCNKNVKPTAIVTQNSFCHCIAPRAALELQRQIELSANGLDI